MSQTTLTHAFLVDIAPYLGVKSPKTFWGANRRFQAKLFLQNIKTYALLKLLHRFQEI